MLASLTAFDVLAFVLVFGIIGALTGWAGGTGARLTYSARLDRVESLLLQVLNRAKGQQGGEVTQQARRRLSSRDEEAEQLAAALASKRGQRKLVDVNAIARVDPDGPQAEAALDALEREAERRGLRQAKTP